MSDKHGHGHDDAQHSHDLEEERDGRDHGHEHHHGHHDHDLETLGYGVVTVSSTRSRGDDPSGDAIEQLVEAADSEVVIREIVTDEHDKVQGIIDRLVDRDDVDCVVTTGGTGVTPDDVTVEAVEPLLDKQLPGFGELFRTMSREEVGTAVVATRATAGVVNGVPVFCLPGSENAVRLGVEEIIVEEAGHLAGLARRE